MRKRGFTLIELLAVIVILAVIALIAVPIILNIISGAKKSSYQRTAEIYTDNLQNLIITANLHGSFNPSWCEYNNETEKTVCEYYDDEKEEYVYEKFDVLTNKTMPKEITMYLYDGFVEEGSYMIFDDDVKASYIDNKWEIIEPIPHSKPIDATVVYYDVKNGALCSEDEYKKSYSSKYDDYLNSATGYNGIDTSDAAITKTLVEGTGTEITPTIENDNSNPWISFNGGYKSDTSDTAGDCTLYTDEDGEEYEDCSVETTFKYKFALTQEGALSFDWSVSSEKYGDELYYRIYLMNDATETQTKISSDYISGTDMFEDENSISYKNVLETLDPGSYMVEFTYSKDSSDYAGYDAGYIKNIKVIEKPQINTTINQNSCLKFYEIGNTATTRDLILDHNTTYEIEWISEEDYDKSATKNEACKDRTCNDQGPITALKQLKEDTKDWVGTNTPINIEINQSGKAYLYVYFETSNTYGHGDEIDYKVSYTIDYNGYKARLITANEVAKLTGNIWFDSTKTSFNNGFVFTSWNNSASGWLNDRFNGCTNYGCLNDNILIDSKYTQYITKFATGYWTSISTKDVIDSAWSIQNNRLEHAEAYTANPGIRPVITINK